MRSKTIAQQIFKILDLIIFMVMLDEIKYFSHRYHRSRLSPSFGSSVNLWLHYQTTLSAVYEKPIDKNPQVLEPQTTTFTPTQPENNVLTHTSTSCHGN